ncbi:hypothetical protein K3495_g3403 [Podosphaera aphanis]|nr:hypothetical protein K3495_g3403 [Podosphaera aphanis]
MPNGLLYMHYYNPISWWMDINKPDQFGFAKNQVTPFNIATPDHEKLYAWHVLPLDVYAEQETELLQQPSGFVNDITRTKAFDLLHKNPKSKLIVYCATFIFPACLFPTLTAFSSWADVNIHVLAFDYRGFGYSTGSPSEPGVTTDGIAALQWALNVAQIPPERIIVFGHSLGTAIACAAVEHFATKGIEFAGLILVSGFTTIPDLLPYYSSGGFVRILSPLDTYPSLQKWFNSHLIETWPTITRLSNLVRSSQKLRLTIIHSLDDNQIPWTQSEALFVAACNATQDSVAAPLFGGIKARSSIELGDEGKSVSIFQAPGGNIIREEIVPYGQHNKIITSAPVVLAVRRAFDFNRWVVNSTHAEIWCHQTKRTNKLPRTPTASEPSITIEIKIHNGITVRA